MRIARAISVAFVGAALASTPAIAQQRPDNLATLKQF
jgi:hypothetical protein